MSDALGHGRGIRARENDGRRESLGRASAYRVDPARQRRDRRAARLSPKQLKPPATMTAIQLSHIGTAQLPMKTDQSAKIRKR